MNELMSVVNAAACARRRIPLLPSAILKSRVCVGTPSQPNGSLELTYVKRVCEEIARRSLPRASDTPSFIRSTICRARLTAWIPALEASSGKKAGQDSVSASTRNSCARDFAQRLLRAAVHGHWR